MRQGIKRSFKIVLRKFFQFRLGLTSSGTRLFAIIIRTNLHFFFFQSPYLLFNSLLLTHGCRTPPLLPFLKDFVIKLPRQFERSSYFTYPSTFRYSLCNRIIISFHIRQLVRLYGFQVRNGLFNGYPFNGCCTKFHILLCTELFCVRIRPIKRISQADQIQAHGPILSARAFVVQISYGKVRIAIFQQTFDRLGEYLTIDFIGFFYIEGLWAINILDTHIFH